MNYTENSANVTRHYSSKLLIILTFKIIRWNVSNLLRNSSKKNQGVLVSFLLIISGLKYEKEKKTWHAFGRLRIFVNFQSNSRSRPSMMSYPVTYHVITKKLNVFNKIHSFFVFLKGKSIEKWKKNMCYSLVDEND